MNAQTTRQDFAGDLKRVFLARIQAREIRKRQRIELVRMVLGLLGYLLAIGLVLAIVRYL